MDKARINQFISMFDEIGHQINSDNDQEQVEVWFARELMGLLGYARWENFQVAIGRAVESCKAQGIDVDDHFREVTKMVELVSGAKVMRMFFTAIYRWLHIDYVLVDSWFTCNMLSKPR